MNHDAVDEGSALLGSKHTFATKRASTRHPAHGRVHCPSFVLGYHLASRVVSDELARVRNPRAAVSPPTVVVKG